MLLDPRTSRVALLLQGGGALGGYQVGAYATLHAALTELGRKVDWVAGISIGAINAAVIAGNEPALRVSRLREIWNDFIWKHDAGWLNALPLGPLTPLVPRYADWWYAALLGMPGFFSSRLLAPLQNPWVAQWLYGTLPPEAAANYDVSALRRTLERFVDFERINAEAPDRTRISLGAARLEDAEMQFFNSFDSKAWGPRSVIGLEHVLASSALPPAFPPVTIAGVTYVDGGCVSNTPLMQLTNDLAARDTIVYDVLVFDRKGALPRTMDEVMWRQKSIQFGSRKAFAEIVARNHEAHVERWIAEGQITPAQAPRLQICQVMYETSPAEPGFLWTDADFSRHLHDRLVTAGATDMRRALQAPEAVYVGAYAALYRIGTLDKWRRSASATVPPPLWIGSAADALSPAREPGAAAGSLTS